MPGQFEVKVFQKMKAARPTLSFLTLTGIAKHPGPKMSLSRPDPKFGYVSRRGQKSTTRKFFFFPGPKKLFLFSLFPRAQAEKGHAECEETSFWTTARRSSQRRVGGGAPLETTAELFRVPLPLQFLKFDVGSGI